MAGAANVRQIWHLIRARCSAGVSRVAFGAWLTASLLITSHAVAIGDAVFVLLGVVQVVATTIVLAYTSKYEGSYCATHLPLSSAESALILAEVDPAAQRRD